MCSNVGFSGVFMQHYAEDSNSDLCLVIFNKKSMSRILLVKCHIFSLQFCLFFFTQKLIFFIKVLTLAVASSIHVYFFRLFLGC